jgi:chromosome segregation protein
LISDFQEIEAKESDELSRLLSEKDKLMNSFYELQERNRILMQRLSKVEREIDKLDMDRSRYDIQIETLIDRMQTDYDLDKDAVLSVSLQVDNVREDQNTIKDLRSRIKELGNVNLGSIEDYRNAVERFQFLTSQLEDLNSAREDIQVVIRDMEKRMRVQFKRSFDEINEKFQQTFSILFNGGKARLELEDGEDILTSGIEIMAQPPGKKLQSLMLLSGGEKSLTAVALLFAILKTKPSPFCILDEIDAALDEANISRYTNYLRTFDDETQFVLITHRKTTMEIADILYGVTMEEEGVSRLISLRLKDYSEAAG